MHAVVRGLGTRLRFRLSVPHFLIFKVGMERGIVGGDCFSKAENSEKMATIGVPVGSPSSTSSGSSPLTLDRDLRRIVELLTILQEKEDVSLPKDQMEQLKNILTSSFFNSVKEVYQHVYETVDVQGSPEVRATATAKATVAAFAASEGQGHPRVVELEKTAEGFGFNVMGGKEQKCPIYISRIIPGGYADRHGGLRRGDQLLFVNGVDLEDANHEKAVDLLKGAQGKVRLVLKYSPKILEEMEFRFENTKSFRRGGRSARH